MSIGRRAFYDFKQAIVRDYYYDLDQQDIKVKLGIKDTDKERANRAVLKHYQINKKQRKYIDHCDS